MREELKKLPAPCCWVHKWSDGSIKPDGRAWFVTGQAVTPNAFMTQEEAIAFADGVCNRFGTRTVSEEKAAYVLREQLAIKALPELIEAATRLFFMTDMESNASATDYAYARAMLGNALAKAGVQL